jgi:ABC-type phosphate transport system substrate-binding protein
MRSLLYTIALLLCVGGSAGAQAAGFVVIVHPTNPVTELPREQLARMFTKKAKRWASGQPVMPVDLAESAKVRAAFTQAVHGKGVSAVKSYWEQQIFSGREVPPAEKGSEAEVLEVVRSTPGAVGYVSADRDLHGVKVLVVR